MCWPGWSAGCKEKGKIRLGVLEYLDQFSGVLTAVATALYVLASVLIYRANYEAVQASLAQLEESRRQFDETRRLECMPCFDVELEDLVSGLNKEVDLTAKLNGEVAVHNCSLILDNIGKGIAQDFRCVILPTGAAETELTALPLVPMQKQSVVNLLFCADTEGFTDGAILAVLRLDFADLLKNRYVQNVEARFTLEHGAMRLEIVRIHAPVPVG